MAAVDIAVPTATFRAMGSDTVVVVDGPHGLLEGARSRIAELEARWSRFLPDSEISALNHTADWVTVSGDTLTLLERSRAASDLSGGAFDPTILPSLLAIGYTESMSESPGRTDLPSTPRRAPAPGIEHVEVDREASRARLLDGTGFDPGGIGKGLAADIVAGELVDAGAAAAIVSVGGDVRVAGEAPPDWVVAVEDPVDRDLAITELRLESGGVCTSSVAAKTWEHEGRMVHHLIDPRSGRPVRSKIVSATVVAGEAWVAEALCKAAILTDPIGALTFLESTGVDGLLVDVDDVVWRTSGLDRFSA